MSNPNPKNLLPKVQLKTKKRKKGKNIIDRNKTNQYLKIESDNVLKTDELDSKNKNINQGPKIIDEVSKSSKRINIIKNKIYKIIFVFRNEDFYITVKINTLIKNMKKEICELIGLDASKFNLMYQNRAIDESYDEKSVGEYFDLKNIKFRPIVYIIKKFKSKVEPSFFNVLIKNYDYKVKIQNYPIQLDNKEESDNSIDNIINNFFKSYYSVNNNNNNLENIYHYKIEPIPQEIVQEEEKKIPNKKENLTFLVCFCSQDIAFDFNRYMNALKLVNDIFKDVKSQVIQNHKKIIKIKTDQDSASTMIRYGVDYGLEDDVNLVKRYTKILRLVRMNYLKKEKNRKFRRNYSQPFINGVDPYFSIFDKARLEEKENKKKWLYPEGFISCVGKYSGIQL